MNMLDSYNTAINVCKTLIGLKSVVTDMDIDNAISQACMIFKSLDKDLLKLKLLSIYSVKIDPVQILEGRERREPWLMSFKASEKSDWLFWNRYKQYLQIQKGF